MKENQTRATREKGYLAAEIGKRIRAARTSKGYTQEKLAELSDCHSTYIGQLERGEKNATLESISKIAAALSVPLSRLFEMSEESETKDNYPLLCYRLIAGKTKSEQARLYSILSEIAEYRNR